MVKRNESGIVAEDELLNYLGNDVKKLNGKVYANTLEKLENYDARTTAEYGLSVIDYLFLAHHQGNRSIRDLSTEVGVSYQTLNKIFRIYKLPIVEQAEAARRKWKNPEFRERHLEAMRNSVDNIRLGITFRHTKEKINHYDVLKDGDADNGADSDQSGKILEAYDRILPGTKTYEEIIAEISKETGIEKSVVKSFLDGYLDVQ